MREDQSLQKARCPVCSHQSNDSARFCEACGTALTFRSAPPPEPFAPVVEIPEKYNGPFGRGMRLGPGGRYAIERVLGRGGYGEAYLATDLQLKRGCVVKRLVMPARYTREQWQQLADDFQHEARLLVSLNSPGHPNIPDIYDYLPKDLSLVMKYIEGRSLEQLLARRVEPFAEEEALRYVRDVCSALVYMHHPDRSEPVLHRDIKPANILLDATKRIWLIDFGLAKNYAAQSTPSIDGRVAGTPVFTPVEQWRGQTEPRSDVFSLAATLHVLLTFYQPEPSQLLDLKHGRAELPPVREFNSAVSVEVERLIQRSVAVDPSRRPTAAQLLDELNLLLGQTLLEPAPEIARPPTLPHVVGRASELAVLDHTLKTRRQIVLTGMAGIGKTTVAAALTHMRHHVDRIFWHTFRREQGMQVPVWRLAAFLARQGQDDLWRLLQSVQNTGGQLPPLDILIDYIIAMLRGRDCQLCFDDIHVVDDDPLFTQFVQRLQAEAQAEALELILISRHVPSFMTTADTITLQGLSVEDSRAFIRERGLTLLDDTFHALYSATEGNAQLLVLAVAALQQADARSLFRSGEPGTSDIARYLLVEVNAGLSDELRDLLSALAVLQDEGGTREALEAVLDRHRLQEGLAELSRRHLVAVRDDQAGRSYYLHAILQTFYHDQLSRRERAALHRRAAVFYESEEIDLSKAVHHFLCARENIRAARLATSDIWAWINRGEAQTLRQLLIRLAAVQLDPSDRVAVAIAQGEIYGVLRETALARSSYDSALAVLKTQPPTLLTRIYTARVSRGMGELLEYVSPQDALDWLNRGLDELAAPEALAWPQEQQFEEALLRLRIGSVLIATGRYAEARAALHTSLRLLPDGPNQWRASAFLKLGVVHCAQGASDEGKAFYLRALEMHQQSNNIWGMIGIWHNLGIELVFAGDWAGAEAEYRKALALAERLGNLPRRATIELSLGYLYSNLGQFAAARTHLTVCLELASQHGLNEYVISSQSSLADLELRLDDWPAAEPRLAEAEQLALKLDSRWQLPEIYRGWALVQLRKGELKRAQSYAERAVRLGHEIEDPREEGMSLRVLARTLALAGRPNMASNTFAQSLELLDGRDPYEAARTRMQWGMELRKPADRTKRIALLAAARASFNALSAQHDLAQLDIASGTEEGSDG